MKALYIVYFDLESDKFLGVNKKIKAQRKALMNLNYNVDYIYISNQNIVYVKNNEKNNYKAKSSVTYYRKDMYKVLKKHINIKEYDFVYSRQDMPIDIYTLKMQKLFEKNRTKHFCEIPTYPLKGGYILRLKGDLKNRKILKFICRIGGYLIHFLISNLLKYTKITLVTFMPYQKIWGAKCIQLDNGVDLDENKKVNKEESDVLRLIIVANISEWHGIDRLIEGIRIYKENKGQRKILFKIIGDTELAEEYKMLVKKYKLTNTIMFLGSLEGEKLNNEFKTADLAVSSLGLHRMGIQKGSTLKTKEYCARGIPFILSYKEEKINEDCNFALKLPSDDSPIDINKVISFYDQIKDDTDLPEKMNKFACDNYSWLKQMEKITDFLEKEKLKNEK